uniref:Uncharacterized protein n=1 Tax=Anguilla anguilla TaxID=7936 RepID=A0A0E9Q4F5_ANGAN
MGGGGRGAFWEMLAVMIKQVLSSG